MNELKLALCSFDPLEGDFDLNVQRCADSIRRAAQYGAQWIVFPEMTLTGFEMKLAECPQSGIPGQSPTLDAFTQLAQQLNMGILFGAVHQGTESKPLNELIAIQAQGQCLGRYAKMHPFSLGREHEYFASGDQLQQIQLQDWTAGLSVCYDLRFPELYRPLAADCALLVNIACWPARRKAHWELLCAARALENRCYFLGVNRTGTDSLGLDYVRSSGIWDPDGLPLPPEHSESDLDFFTLDPLRVRKARLSLPSLRDRRPTVYSGFFALEKDPRS
jgi:omega-amidase